MELDDSTPSDNLLQIIPFRGGAGGDDLALRSHAFAAATDEADDIASSSSSSIKPVSFTQVITCGAGAETGLLMQAELSPELPLTAPRPVAKLRRRNILDLSCGPESTAVLTDVGECFVAGLNDEKQLIAEEEAQRLLVPRLVDSVSHHRVISLALGERHQVVLTSNTSGNVLSFGSNEHGALGHSADKSSCLGLPPRMPKGFAKLRILQVAAGATHSLFLSDRGQVFSVGSGVRGALGHGDRSDKQEPALVEALSSIPVVFIAAGDSTSFCVSASGSAFSWGYNKTGQLGLPVATYQHASYEPVRVEGLPELVQSVACGDSHTVWVSRSGRVYSSGKNDCGQLGLGWSAPDDEDGKEKESDGGAMEVDGHHHHRHHHHHHPFIDRPALVKALQDVRIREVACGRRHTIFLSASGDVYGCGDGRDGAFGVTIPFDLDLFFAEQQELKRQREMEAEQQRQLEEATKVSKPAPLAGGFASLPALRKVGTFSTASEASTGSESNNSNSNSNSNSNNKITPVSASLPAPPSTPASSWASPRPAGTASFAPVPLSRALSVPVSAQQRSMSFAGSGAGAAGPARLVPRWPFRSPPSYGSFGSFGMGDDASAAAAAATSTSTSASASSASDNNPLLRAQDSFSLVTAEDARELREIGEETQALQSQLDEMDLSTAFNGCLWAPAKVPGLSGKGVFRVSSAGEHSAFLRITKGSVLSLAPGALAAASMPFVDAASLVPAAKEAASSQNFVTLKRMLREAFASPAILSGSFLSRPAEDLAVAAMKAANKGGSATATATGPLPLVVFQAVSASSAAAATPNSPAASAPTPAGPQLTSVVIAPAKTGPVIPSSRFVESSGIDVPAVEATFGSVLTTYDPDVVEELVKAHSQCADELCANAGRLFEPDSLRALLITLLSPLNSRPSLTASVVAKLCLAILSIPQASRDLLFASKGWVARDVPGAIMGSRLVAMLQTHVSHHLKETLNGRAYAIAAVAQVGSFLEPLPSSSGSSSSSSAASRETSAGAGAAAPSRPFAGAGAAPGSGGGNAGSGSASSGGSAAAPATTVIYLTTPDGRVIGQIPASSIGGGLSAASMEAESASPNLATILEAAAASNASSSGAAEPTAPFSSAFVSAAAAPSSTAAPAPAAAPKPAVSPPAARRGAFVVKETQVSHLYALELAVRVLRLLFNLNEELGSEAQAALLPAETNEAAAASTSPASIISSGSSGSEQQAWSLSQVPLGMKVPPSAFYNRDLCDGLPEGVLQLDFKRWAHAGFKRTVGNGPLILCAYPFLLDAPTKRKILAFENDLSKQTEAHNAIARSFFASQESPYLVLTVRRDHILQDTLNAIVSHRPGELKKPLRVVFDGEEAVDAGGPRKELFQLLLKQMMDPLYGLFKENERTRLYWFNQAPLPGSERDYFLVGVTLALACYNDVNLDLSFPAALYKKLLGGTLGLYDLRQVDPELAAGFEKLLAYDEADPANGGATVEDVFCLSFEAAFEAFGEQQTVELVPGGKDKPVTAANRHEYVRQYADWYLNQAVASSFKDFVKGFVLVMSGQSLNLFRPEELQVLVEGTTELDFKALEAVTQYDGGYSADHPTIKAFWKVVKGFNHDEKVQLLQFFSGVGKAPAGGLGKLVFKIQRAGPDSERLPTASVCFGVLLLPEYGNVGGANQEGENLGPEAAQEKLRSKLVQAIKECVGFGLR